MFDSRLWFAELFPVFNKVSVHQDFMPYLIKYYHFLISSASYAWLLVGYKSVHCLSILFSRQIHKQQPTSIKEMTRHMKNVRFSTGNNTEKQTEYVTDSQQSVTDQLLSWSDVIGTPHLVLFFCFKNSYLIFYIPELTFIFHFLTILSK